MQLRKNILNQIEQILDKDTLTIAGVCFFMQSVRLLLEIDENKSKYKFTNHYCNWLLHKELDKSISPLIINIADSFQDFSSKNDLIEKITKSLSLIEFIEELKEILWVNLDKKDKLLEIDNDEFWLKIIQVILSQILFRPLKLKKKNIELEGMEITIYGIQILNLKDKYNLELLSDELIERQNRLVFDIAFFKD